MFRLSLLKSISCSLALVHRRGLSMGYDGSFDFEGEDGALYPCCGPPVGT